MSQSFEMLKIIEELRKIRNETLLAKSIMIAIGDPAQWTDLIDEIKTNVAADPALFLPIIGEKTWELIKKL